jgi:NAD-dependent oxidoreductase involved in siderophore biosynthesis
VHQFGIICWSPPLPYLPRIDSSHFLSYGFTPRTRATSLSHATRQSSPLSFALGVPFTADWIGWALTAASRSSRLQKYQLSHFSFWNRDATKRWSEASASWVEAECIEEAHAIIHGR